MANPLRRPQGSYLAQARSFFFDLPLAGQYFADGTPAPQEILTPEQTQARSVSFVATIIQTSTKFNVRLPPVAGGQVIPLVFIGFDQGKLAQAQPGNATMLPLDVVVTLPVPPGKRMYANFRGDSSTLAVIPSGYQILVSVWVTALLEATADGEPATSRIVDALDAGFDRLAGLLASLKS
jgi:hypothetical protein